MLIPKQTALSDRLLEYLDFLRLQAIAGRDKEFLSSHKKDWYHGVSAPFTLVKYAPFEAFNKAHFGRTVDSEIYLNPHITLEKVSLPHADTRSSSLDSLSKSEEETLKYTEIRERSVSRGIPKFFKLWLALTTRPPNIIVSLSTSKWF